ncbi:MAG: methyltransferase domain-containing protein [Planctomycetes bacterium]|nr:methyltransferase domain-containing protein [Planctomycetota bacterium]
MKRWDVEGVLEIIVGYQQSSVLAAGADLEVFDLLSEGGLTAAEVAEKLEADGRATEVMLNALACMELLVKRGDVFETPGELVELLTKKGAKNVLPIVQHLSNCARRWVHLAEVVQSGKPAERKASVRGEAGDQESFIGAMHNFSGPDAEPVVRSMGELSFKHLLDVGGGPGTWTMALLRAAEGARATIFDYPAVVKMAEKRIGDEGFGDRVDFVGGDFYVDELPKGVDFVWLGAIAHQNSREQNRELFGKVYRAMEDGGVMVVRDVVMAESGAEPVRGAMFAINMLVATPGGGTYTLNEYREDMMAAGFKNVELIREDEYMNSLVRAEK